MTNVITSLKEFTISRNQNIRGILTNPDGNINKIVICLHGFERCSSTESKFKKLSDKLGSVGIAALRLDFSGCGLSDGDFKYTTVSGQAKEFEFVLDKIKRDYDQIAVISHSLGACVIASQTTEVRQNIDKTILLAPALNQADLLRFWFTIGKMKKIDPDKVITWNNFEEFFNQEEFLLDCRRTDKTTKANFIDSDYFLQNMNVDYSSKFSGTDGKILHIHGSNDNIVPIESLSIHFNNTIIVSDGDHDLEKPIFMSQWLDRVVNFIAE